MAADLDGAWEVLAEAAQTVMRKHHLPDAYERLKTLTRGSRVGRGELREFISALPIPLEDKDRLLRLEPASYIGLAEDLALLDFDSD